MRTSPLPVFCPWLMNTKLPYIQQSETVLEVFYEILMIQTNKKEEREKTMIAILDFFFYA